MKIVRGRESIKEEQQVIMTEKQRRELAHIKKLINKGYKKFAERADRDYLPELLEIGITEELAWEEVLTLTAINYVHDYKPYYSKSGRDALTFKKEINGYIVYIKLKIEEYDNNEIVVCMSFHKDHR